MVINVKEKKLSAHKELVSGEAVEALKSIGLNLYERKLYVALLAKGTATAGELSELSGVPRARVYDVLESLADKGFVIIQQSKPLRYVALSPKEALDRAANVIKEKMKSSLELLQKFKENPVIEQLEKLHQERLEEIDSAELVGTVKGKYIIDQHEESILRNSRESIDIITSDEGLKELYRKYAALLQEAYEQGIKIRILAPITEENKKIAEILSDIAEIRNINIDEVPYTRMILGDKKQAVVHLTHDKETHPVQQTSIWTGTEHFVSNFASKLYEMLWEKGEKVF